ncbi:DeoR/GlpR family DNA-binding transcription regulator [Lichenicoccus sp.]|uniref:DeoR/GlpR family DNA-binding transcription regulator n=1 Tax=Lichenicoccus sp. TaxID=2781899 RepID=UPI003D105380
MRLDDLSALVGERGSVRLAEAAHRLGVSAMTLRRDLAGAGAGAGAGAAVELLGGHVIASSAAARSRYRLEDETDSHAPAKRLAAERAARLVGRGDTLFIDCGTTMPHLVAALPRDLDLTIVCYALNIAALAAQVAGARLYLLGGLFHASSATFTSDDALRGLHRIGINKAFLSAGGLDARHGATCSNFNEAPVKRAVIGQAQHSVLVLDSSKLGQVKPVHFAAAGAFGQIMTEHGVLPQRD